jgi:heme exporter protein D
MSAHRLSFHLTVTVFFPAQIGRNYEVLFQEQFGGLAILQRIPNTPAAKAEWARNASVRYNRTITPTVFPMLADKDDEEVYIIADVVPDRRPQSDYIGFQVTVIDDIRLPLRAMRYHWDNVANYSTLWPVFGKPTTFTGLFAMPDFGTGEQALSFMSITAIFDDDPTKHVVMTLSSPFSYLKTARTRPKSTVATITDHFGVSVTYGDCHSGDTVHVLRESLSLTSSISWTFEVGQCPAYEAEFVTSKRYTVLAVCIVVTVLALITTAVVMLLQHRMVLQAVQQTRAEEKSHAQQLIVGYVCHELRNPLHVVLTSFRSVISSLCHYTGNYAYKREAIGESGNEEEELEGFEDTPSEEELLSIVRDAMASMHQMQTTVNEILDFRAITTGLSSLKINTVPVCVGKVCWAMVV